MNDDTVLLGAWRDLCAEGSFAATHLAFLIATPEKRPRFFTSNARFFINSEDITRFLAPGQEFKIEGFYDPETPDE